MGETIVGVCLIEKRQRELPNIGGRGRGRSLYVYKEAGRRIRNMAAAGVEGLPAEKRNPFCSKKNWGGGGLKV